jgi:hypothetical protein
MLLMVTELVTNALKYASPRSRSAGRVVVAYEVVGLNWKLSISDLGVGGKLRVRNRGSVSAPRQIRALCKRRREGTCQISDRPFQGAVKNIQDSWARFRMTTAMKMMNSIQKIKQIPGGPAGIGGVNPRNLFVRGFFWRGGHPKKSPQQRQCQAEAFAQIEREPWRS